MSEVLVIGGSNTDIKARCASAHVAATSNPAHISHKPGGVARNIAHNLGRLGAKVSLLSVVGYDAAGEGLLKSTALAGVDVSRCFKASGVTGTYLAFLDDHGELITAANNMEILQAITPDIIAQHTEAITTARLVIVDCNLPVETLAIIAKLASAKLIVEPVSVSKAQKLKKLGTPIFLATPNLDQVEALTGTRDPQTAAKFLHESGIFNLVIHAGSQGAYVSDGASFIHLPARAHRIIDVTGTGDAATAGLALGLLSGMPLAKAAELGQDMAAKVIASTASTLE